MKRIVTILAVLMISAVVVQAQLIWPTESKGIIFKKYGPKIETVKPPTGFTVTPAEVSEMFAPRKFMSHDMTGSRRSRKLNCSVSESMARRVPLTRRVWS